LVIGIGIDLVQLASFKCQLDDPATTFAEATFTPAEREYCATSITKDPTLHYAARYAAKEAAVKALDAACALAGITVPLLNLGTIEVIRDPVGRPSLKFHGAASELAQTVGVDRAHLSITHEADYASAVVCLERLS